MTFPSVAKMKIRKLVEYFAYIFLKICFYITKNCYSATNSLSMPGIGNFQSYGLENKSIWAVFRVKYDGDIRFCVAPSKSRFSMIFIDLF